MDLYIHSLIRLHGIVLNSLSTGTNLPLPIPNIHIEINPVTDSYKLENIWAYNYFIWCTFETKETSYTGKQIRNPIRETSNYCVCLSLECP
jgi:hypothetical protein